MDDLGYPQNPAGVQIRTPAYGLGPKQESGLGLAQLGYIYDVPATALPIVLKKVADRLNLQLE